MFYSICHCIVVLLLRCMCQIWELKRINTGSSYHLSQTAPRGDCGGAGRYEGERGADHALIFFLKLFHHLVDETSTVTGALALLTEQTHALRAHIFIHLTPVVRIKSHSPGNTTIAHGVTRTPPQGLGLWPEARGFQHHGQRSSSIQRRPARFLFFLIVLHVNDD